MSEPAGLAVVDVYLDACCFIYLVEGHPSRRSIVEGQIRALDPTTRLLTSQLSRLECRAKPMREGDTATLDRYDALFAASRVLLLEVTAAVIDRATAIRAQHGFKTPDAIHLATAVDSGASTLWTGDASLARFVDVTTVVLAPASPL
jgi:predicted nucleic acid-binding protein